jgi:N-acetyl-anhydromuramyl-L-alanine amidase AmpD
MKVRQGAVGAALVAITACMAACSSDTADASAPRVDPSSSTGSLSVSFAHAAERTGVPRDLLVAIAHVEDGLTMPAQRLDLEEDSAVPAAGPLMLRRGKLDTLGRAATLAGKTELELRKNTDSALDAGALVLAELGQKTGATASDITSWKAAVEEMSGYADEAHREEYAHRVFAALARGGALEGRDGETILLAKHDLPPALTLDISFKLHSLAVAQFPGAEWIPTSCNSKCTPGRDGNNVQYIVIHDTEGGWDASVSTLQNDPNKSVQYIVGTDGRTAQFVTEETTAWHAGNFYFNQRSIGIEHVGKSTQPYTEANYVASAKLVNHLADKYGVPRDRAHIIGHDQIPDGKILPQSAAPCSDSPRTCEGNMAYGGLGHHTDPGVWEWATYMERIKGTAKCNDVTEIVNCSSDKKSAFKCTGGKVIVDACRTCEVKPNGQDDVCDVIKPATAETPVTESPTPSGGTIAETTAAPAKSTTAAEDSTSSEEPSNGCSTTGRSGGRSSGLGIGLVLAAAALASRRRRG